MSVSSFGLPLSSIKHNDGPKSMEVGPEWHTSLSQEKVKFLDEVFPSLNAFHSQHLPAQSPAQSKNSNVC